MKQGLRKELLVFWLLVVLAVAGMLYYGGQKEGYHVDELYSYGLANSEYLPFMHFGTMEYSVKDWMKEYGAGESPVDLVKNILKDVRILKENRFAWRDSVIYSDYLRAQANSADMYTTTWVSGQDYRDYLAVSRENTFNYASVYYNQRGDVHPPLYYICLHTISSLFPQHFSKWYGLFINLIFMVLSLLVLWHMVKNYLGGEKAALAVTAAYGLSCGFVNTAIFLRMYGLLTLMVLWCLDMHLGLVRDDFCPDRKRRRRLALSVLLGYLTHYYFVLYVIGIALIVSIWMAVKKRWKPLIRYVLTMAVTAVVGIAVWPFSLKHVFAGYRGRETLHVLTAGSFSRLKTKWMSDYVFSHMLGGRRWIAVVFLIVFVMAAVLLRDKRLPWGKLLLVFLPAVVYLIIVSQIVPFVTDRYIMCTYPFLCIFMICGSVYVCRRLRERLAFIPTHAETVLTLGVGVLMLLCNNFVLHPPVYLYEGGQETVQIPKRTVCVYVLPDGDWNESAQETNLLAQCEQVAVVYMSDLECLRDTYQYEEGQNILVTIQKGLDEEEVLKRVRDVLAIGTVPEQSRRYGADNTKVFLTQKD